MHQNFFEIDAGIQAIIKRREIDVGDLIGDTSPKHKMIPRRVWPLAIVNFFNGKYQYIC